MAIVGAGERETDSNGGLEGPEGAWVGGFDGSPPQFASSFPPFPTQEISFDLLPARGRARTHPPSHLHRHQTPVAPSFRLPADGRRIIAQSRRRESSSSWKWSGSRPGSGGSCSPATARAVARRGRRRRIGGRKRAREVSLPAGGFHLFISPRPRLAPAVAMQLQG